MYVKVEEHYDRFDILVCNNDGTVVKEYGFDQEDSVKDLVKVFEFLDWDAVYEEVC